jgi:hypothetical protein
LSCRLILIYIWMYVCLSGCKYSGNQKLLIASHITVRMMYAESKPSQGFFPLTLPFFCQFTLICSSPPGSGRLPWKLDARNQDRAIWRLPPRHPVSAPLSLKNAAKRDWPNPRANATTEYAVWAAGSPKPVTNTAGPDSRYHPA